MGKVGNPHSHGDSTGFPTGRLKSRTEGIERLDPQGVHGSTFPDGENSAELGTGGQDASSTPQIVGHPKTELSAVVFQRLQLFFLGRRATDQAVGKQTALRDSAHHNKATGPVAIHVMDDRLARKGPR